VILEVLFNATQSGTETSPQLSAAGLINGLIDATEAGVQQGSNIAVTGTVDPVDSTGRGVASICQRGGRHQRARRGLFRQCNSVFPDRGSQRDAVESRRVHLANSSLWRGGRDRRRKILLAAASLPAQ